MKVHDLIGTAWGDSHFDLASVSHIRLQEAFDDKTIGCGAAGCVSGFLPLVNKRIRWSLSMFVCGGRRFDYSGIASHKEGFGLSPSEVGSLCLPESYGRRWTRAKVRARARSIVAKYHPDLAKAGERMRSVGANR